MKNISNILAGINDNSSERDLMIAVNELIDIINARRRSKDQAKRNDRRQICKEIKKLLAKGHHTTIMNVPEGFSFNGIDREGSYQVYIEKAFNEKVGVRCDFNGNAETQQFRIPAEWLDLEFLATNEADKSITSFRYKAKELSEGFQNALRGE